MLGKNSDIWGTHQIDMNSVFQEKLVSNFPEKFIHLNNKYTLTILQFITTKVEIGMCSMKGSWNAMGF